MSVKIGGVAEAAAPGHHNSGESVCWNLSMMIIIIIIAIITIIRPV